MKRLISMLLCTVMVFSLLPTAFAMEQEQEKGIPGRHPAETVEYDSLFYQTLEPIPAAPQAVPAADFTYETMVSSQSLVDLIKDCEGFSATPYLDYSQYTIGYGTRCGYTEEDVPAEYWEGITEEKGQELLQEYLTETAEKEVNKFFAKIGRQPLQQQFDAMVDFTFALGSAWMYEDSRVRAWLTNPTTELGLVRALGAWCRVGGKVSSPTCNRRMREAIIYLYGVYLLPNGQFESELDVVYNGNLPFFRYVIYDGNGTTLINTRTDDVYYYYDGGSYDTLINPVREGYDFYGWLRKEGDLLLPGHKVDSNLWVTAQWTNSPFTDVPQGTWYTQAATYCFEKELIKGMTDTTFAPMEVAKRAMVVTVLYRMAGSPAVSGDSGFSDVPDNRYFHDAVTWAVEQGITTGKTAELFDPDAPVTRAELITFLYRYAQKVLNRDTTAPDLISGAVDIDQMPNFARDAFNWGMSEGLISGMSNAELRLEPRGIAVRAQLAKMLMYLNNLQ